jgi:cytosine/adenosine deaminase-related metal-dependent hydrolase
MSRTLIHSASVLAGPGGDGEAIEADILVEGQRIAAMGRDLTADGAEIVEAGGLLALPGLINAHLHSAASFKRGTLEGSRSSSSCSTRCRR